MTTTDSDEGGALSAPPAKKRGAPKGNRNAWKHGARSVAAKRAREEARARVVATLPDAQPLQNAAQFGDAARRLLKRRVTRAAKRDGRQPPDFLTKSPRREGGGVRISPNKTNNSDPPPRSEREQLQNSIAEEPRKRGAPKGNRNALKHGVKSREWRSVHGRLREVCSHAHAISGLAAMIAATRQRKPPVVEYTTITYHGDRRIVVTKIVKRPDSDHPITITPNKGRVVVKAGGRTIADTRHALTLREANYPPVQYIPRADVDMSLLSGSSHSTYCPYKGDASYFNLPAAPDSVWSYETPHPAMAAIRNHLAFYPNRVDSIEVSD